MKKYELTTETKVVFGRTLYRIRALCSFGDINKGDLGGWIEKEENLSQDGNAWISGNATVSGNAWVYGNAEVCGDAKVYGNAKVCGNAWISGNATVSGNAWVYGNAEVSGNAWVYGNATVCGNAKVYGNAWVCGDAKVYGNAWVYGNATVCGNAKVIWISNIGSRNGTTTFFARKDKKIGVTCGCFYGDIEEFAAKVKTTHGDNEHAKAYMLAIELAKLRIKVEDNE